ncbi:TetR family transcriptional regulator [Streptomyces sp. SID685]|uniref:TetR/AcrR family transcriptional regulator n=1 Tax=Streptomyces sp. SID685 TaxID=2690322 RepID=UPI00137148A7|nr:TetR/AcrR family transcriptional regulator [Streptomyces sp. SID685]MYR85241.1 TetR family transcriptional regulator [Streptomyces sp. SID685]
MDADRAHSRAAGSAAEPAMSVWQRLAQPTLSQRPVLTHARIVAAALRVADTDGLDAVSMRRLATELGVSAMTCYRYVSGKEDIIELMLDKVRAEMLLERPGGTWHEVLRDSALRFRQVVLRHPWMTEVPGRILFAPTPAHLALVEQQFTALDGLGLTMEQMADVAGAITAYARARTHDEITRARLRAPEGWTSGGEAREANLARLSFLLEAGDYPLYQRYVRQTSPHEDEDARFTFGLDCLLDGIAARLDLPRRAPR